MILEFQVFIYLIPNLRPDVLFIFTLFPDEILRSKGSSSHLWLYWQSHGRGWPRQPPFEASSALTGYVSKCRDLISPSSSKLRFFEESTIYFFPESLTNSSPKKGTNYFSSTSEPTITVLFKGQPLVFRGVLFAKFISSAMLIYHTFGFVDDVVSCGMSLLALMPSHRKSINKKVGLKFPLISCHCNPGNQHGTQRISGFHGGIFRFHAEC